MLAAQTEPALALESRPTAEECTVRICRTWEELEQFRESWNRLLQANPTSSIFQTPEWLAAWWKAFPGIRNCSDWSSLTRKAIRLALPLFIVSKTLFSGVRSPRCAWLARDQEILTRSISLRRRATKRSAPMHSWHGSANKKIGTSVPWRRFRKIRLWQSGLARACMKPNGAWIPRSRRTLLSICRHAWPQYLNALEPSFRPLLTRYPKRLQSRYSVRFVRCECVDDLKVHLETLFSLHQMRWTGRGEPGAFANPDRQDFYFEMAAAFLQRGWLEFWLLELDGEIVGAQFCFRYNETVSLLQEGFHPKYAAEKIGYALRAHVLEEMIRSGAKRYDFLGGDDPYKAKFGAQQKNYLNLTFAGPSRLGRAYLALRRRKRQIKTWLKSKLPAGVLARLRRDAAAQVASASQ